MDQIIKNYYRVYGEYINGFRSFPSIIDGLKPVERRVMLTGHLVAKSKFVKCAKIDGTCIASFHPHGSIYGTCVQLANQGFFEKQGNFGCNFGVEPMPPAAMRYTEAKLQDWIEQMCFQLIDYVPWIQGEIEEKEPEYLPTMFPLCLLGEEFTQGIGFGYRTYIPCYELTDLYKRLLWLLGIEKTEPIIKPKTDCKILATKDELQTLLTTGKSKISVQGKMLIDKGHCKVILKSWPPGRRFASLLTKFQDELNNQDIGFIDSSNGTSGTSITFSVLKQRNRDKIFNTFIKKLESALNGSISFEIITTGSDGKVKSASIDSMLLQTFEMYKNVNEKMLIDNINKIQNQIDELNLLATIKPHLKTSWDEDLEKATTQISIKSKISEDVVREVLGKYRIKKLFTVNTDTSALVSEKSSFEGHLKDVHKYILTKYNSLGGNSNA